MTELLAVRLLHFAGFTLGVGGIIAMALLVVSGTRHKAAGILADVGATLTIASGVYNAIHGALFKMPWLHIKLTLVVVLIVVHSLLRVRMRKGKAGGAIGLLATAVVLVVAIQAVVIFRVFSHG